MFWIQPKKPFCLDLSAVDRFSNPKLPVSPILFAEAPQSPDPTPSARFVFLRSPPPSQSSELCLLVFSLHSFRKLSIRAERELLQLHLAVNLVDHTFLSAWLISTDLWFQSNDCGTITLGVTSTLLGSIWGLSLSTFPEDIWIHINIDPYGKYM